MPSKHVLDLLVVGSGRMGNIRMKAAQLSQNSRLCGIVDVDTAAAEKYSSLYNVPLAKNIETFIQTEGKPDAIWVSTPTHTHFELIKFAAQHSIPIATEKPVAMDPVTIETSYNLCDDAAIPLFCSFQRRCDTTYQQLKKQLNGKDQSIQSMHSVFRDHPIPPIEFLVTGGDLFHDCGVHDIDFAHSLLPNQQIKTVFALANSFHPLLKQNNVQDMCNALLKFDNNIAYQIEVSRISQYGYDLRFEVFTDQACIKVENQLENNCQVQNFDGIHLSKYENSFPERFYHAFVNEVVQFADICINGPTGNDSLVSCQDSCRATQVAEACRLSFLNQCIIDIEYDSQTHSRCNYQPRSADVSTLKK